MSAAVDRAELRRLAEAVEAVAPGPWIVGLWDRSVAPDGIHYIREGAWDAGNVYRPYELPEDWDDEDDEEEVDAALGAYIAALDPTTVLALLDELDRAPASPVGVEEQGPQ